MKYFLFICFTMCSTIGLLGQTNSIHFSSYGFYQFSHNMLSFSLYNMGDNYDLPNSVIEVKAIPITWVENDPYNENETSFSFPLNSILIASAMVSTIQNKSSFYYFVAPIMLTGGRYHFKLMEFEKSNNVARYVPQFVSIVMKSDLDLFCFNKNNWVNYSPGIGVAIFYFSLRAQIGVNSNIAFFENTKKHELSLFFEFSLIGRDG